MIYYYIYITASSHLPHSRVRALTANNHTLCFHLCWSFSVTCFS